MLSDKISSSVFSLDLSSPFIFLFPKDNCVSVQFLVWCDLWLYTCRRRIKWRACMCSLFIANTNEKWAHPFPLGFTLVPYFLSPHTVQLPLHVCQRGIWKELRSPLDHKKGKCLPCRAALIWRRRCAWGPQWVSRRNCWWTECTKCC